MKAALIAAICFCAALAAYPTSIWPFEMLAQAPVLATCIVRTTSREATPITLGRRVVPAHATLAVLRSYPSEALGDTLHLDYEALPEGDNGMSGPDVPLLSPGAVVALALKRNPQPGSTPWRLIGDEGQGLLVPAIAAPPSGPRPANGREFLLLEIASALAAGTRDELFAEVGYVMGQRTIASELMALLEPKLDEARWTQIASAILCSMGIPHNPGPFLTAVQQERGDSEGSRARLIHQLLLDSDIRSWGAGVSLREYAGEPGLVAELRSMLAAHRSGSLSVARDVLGARQKEILPDAVALALHYISAPGTDEAEIRPACAILRDFATAAEFNRLLAEIRKSQFQNRRHYDELWRSTIWSDNDRERAVLEILLADSRVYSGDLRYSDVARGELVRLKNRRPPPG